jgi:hypothetical protein
MIHRPILRAFIVLSWLTVAAPLNAAPLWGRVEAGMTLEQLRAVYPELRPTLPRHTYVLADKIEQFQNCPAVAVAVFVRGVVDRVVLTGQPEALRKCYDGIEETLTNHFGKARRLGVLREWIHDGIRWLLNPLADPTVAIPEGPVSPQWSVSFSVADEQDAALANHPMVDSGAINATNDAVAALMRAQSTNADRLAAS